VAQVFGLADVKHPIRIPSHDVNTRLLGHSAEKISAKSLKQRLGWNE
jgi:hypothetical protein